MVREKRRRVGAYMVTQWCHAETMRCSAEGEGGKAFKRVSDWETMRSGGFVDD
jgi:hypothetical protein